MRAAWLKRHEAAYFSNDMLYHTMIGLLGIETNCYRAAEDLSAEEYGYDRASVLTFWGETHIAEDAT